MFRILVVDDDKNTRMLLKAVLEAENYNVETAENGEAALAVMEHDISFRDVTVELCRTTGRAMGTHDLRPTLGPTSTEKGLCHVCGHNADHVRFRDCDFRAEPALEPEIADSFRCTHCRDWQM